LVYQDAFLSFLGSKNPQSREETLALELPKPRNRILVEFDATLVQAFLKASGRPTLVSNDRLELTRAFVEAVTQIASRHAQ